MKNIENLITEYDDFRYWLKNDLKNQNEIRLIIINICKIEINIAINKIPQII